MRPNGRLVPGEEYRIGHYPDADGEERDVRVVAAFVL